MTTLYYLPGAVCAQKALIAMIAKGVELETRAMTREDLATPEYRLINAKGVVPTLVTDQGVITESSTIMRFIDEAFEGPALQPADPLPRARMNNWMKLMDEDLFPAIGYFTMATLLRDDMRKVPQDELMARLTRTAGAAVGAMRAEAAWHGAESRAVGNAIATWRGAFKAMAAQLEQTPWLAGDDLSLAEVALAPAFLRLGDLGLADWWGQEQPRVAAWWEQLKASDPMTAFVARFPNPMSPGLHASAGELRGKVAAMRAA